LMFYLKLKMTNNNNKDQINTINRYNKVFNERIF